jgi:hypothetical protein
MSWRDLKPLPDDWYEPERPVVFEDDRAVRKPDGEGVAGFGGHIALTFEDDLSRQWFAEWLRSKRGWTAFMAWVDEKR